MFVQRLSKSAVTTGRQQAKLPFNALVNDFSTRKIEKYPRPLNTKKRGIDILKDSLWNKSLAFSESERDRLGLRGLIPPAVRTIEDQVKRVLGHLRAEPSDVQKNLYLQDLHNRNETLYHRLLVEHVSSISFHTSFLVFVSGCRDCSLDLHSHCGHRVPAVRTQIYSCQRYVLLCEGQRSDEHHGLQLAS